MYKKLSSLVMLVAALVGCSNIYSPLANKQTNEAYYEEAMKALDDRDYDSSIAYFEQLTASYRATPKVRERYAGALAGKCGFSFAGFLNYMGTADFGSTPFFRSLMNQFTGAVINPTYCSRAEAEIKGIWATQSATQSQKLFMVMLSMSKMGAYMRNKADVDGTDNLGDNAPDAGFDVCTSSSTGLTDDEIKEVVTGFSLMLMNITDFLTSFSSSTGSTMTAIQAACGLMSPNPCATTEASGVDAAMVHSMRNILATNAAYAPLPLGIGTCTLPTMLDSCCP